MSDSRKESPPAIRFGVKLAALSVGLCAAALFLVALEGVFWALTKHRDASFSGEQPYLFEFSTLLGYKPRANVDARATKFFGDQLLYDVVYRTDEVGRRRTPLFSESPDQFVAFFGCSYTFGEGVAEGETLPAQTGALIPDARVYNYGFSGYGPQQLLAKLDSGELRSEIEEARGDLVYVFMADHVRRAIGSMRVWNQWGRHFPCYELDANGGLIGHGSFLTARPTLSNLYDFMKHDRILPYFNVDFPVRLREDDFALTAKILGEARRRFESEYPESRFQVLLYPRSPSDEFDTTRMLPWLKAEGISVLDFSRKIDLDDPRFSIAHDGHPSAAAHGEVGRLLANELRCAPLRDE